MTPRSAESLIELLGDEGAPVEPATNGAEGASTSCARPARLHPCVILLDLMMPVMNSQEFYAEQQRDPALATIPIVVISANKNIALKATGINGRFLSKPGSPGDGARHSRRVTAPRPRVPVRQRQNEKSGQPRPPEKKRGRPVGSS